MQKAKLYWVFYKSTLVLNLAGSVLISFVVYFGLQAVMKTSPPVMPVYIHSCMYGGPMLCFYYKETSLKNEYYFYYNRGITKLQLWIATYTAYIVLGQITLHIVR